MRTKEWLKNARMIHNLTQEELANKIGVSKYSIENIEQGKRLGSVDTWKRIEDFFFGENSTNVSYECEGLIFEIKGDIEEFGENHGCYLFYRVENDRIFFTNYDFVVPEMPLEENELLEGEKYIETSLKYALEVFEHQNKFFRFSSNKKEG